MQKRIEELIKTNLHIKLHASKIQLELIYRRINMYLHKFCLKYFINLSKQFEYLIIVLQ